MRGFGTVVAGDLFVRNRAFGNTEQKDGIVWLESENFFLWLASSSPESVSGRRKRKEATNKRRKEEFVVCLCVWGICVSPVFFFCAHTFLINQNQ